MPILFMVELAAADPAASRVWYEEVLGLKFLLADAATGFVLLGDDRGGRVALKAGTPTPGGVTLHFEVPDVDAALRERGLVAVGPTTVSSEGYREVFVHDPDGYRIGLFAWDHRDGTELSTRG
jgi:catechol 2,3-dioxygenase-like lactoylglutathione lyase family enzyme